jgi:hypothetical protein
MAIGKPINIAVARAKEMRTKMTQNIIKALAATSLTLLVGCATHQPGAQNANAWWSRWEKSDGGNGHWYKAVAATNGITWMQADKLARAEDGYLATITSKEENAFVFKLVNSPEFFTDFNGCGPALGGFQLDEAAEPDGCWRWVTGEPWKYSNWHSGEPNNYKFPGLPPEDRLIFYSGTSRTPSATWGDFGRNDIHTGGYVIERDK